MQAAQQEATQEEVAAEQAEAALEPLPQPPGHVAGPSAAEVPRQAENQLPSQA